jgi:DNA modification methylase
LIAAQSSGRVCYAVEIDPIYVDVAIRRWQAFCGEQAIRERDGKSFAALAAPAADTASEPVS